MKATDVPAELRDWHFGVQRDLDAKQAEYSEGRSRPAPAVAASSSELTPPVVTASFDEVIDAIPYRTEVEDDGYLNEMLGVDDNTFARLAGDNPEHEKVITIKQPDIPMDYILKPPRYAEIDDASIATKWLDPRRRGIDRIPAAYKGRPFLCRGDEGFPNRLYHRTTHDAAFNILEDGLVPGFRHSGKFHCYFAKATLAELGNKAGVRANLHVELVFDTIQVLKHAYLFETESEGILCSER
ncbi:unnamed protein product, partial [Symbiodinium sp. CCMP2456]